MNFAFWAAIWAGTLGGAVMFGTRLLMKHIMRLDLKMDMMGVWGSMLHLHGMIGHVVGLLIHLAGSAAIGLIYAWAFAALLGTANNLWLWGLLGGLIHWVLAGLFFAVLPALHPEIPERRPNPGAFIKNFGAPDGLGFLIGHLVYGVAVAILYAYFTGGGTAAAF